jgi:superfamily II DNA helicase RecQ
MILESID